MLKGGIIKRGLTERKINAIFEVTYMTDGSGSDHGEYNSLTADRLGRKVPGSVGFFFIRHLRNYHKL